MFSLLVSEYTDYSMHVKTHMKTNEKENYWGLMMLLHKQNDSLVYKDYRVQTPGPHKTLNSGSGTLIL